MTPVTDDDRTEITADTPLGKIAAKGLKLQDTIALFILIGMIAVIAGGIQVYKTIVDHQTHTEGWEKTFISAIKEAAMAQRMQTCILSVPQEKREQEYMSPNSFCRQMAALPSLQ